MIFLPFSQIHGGLRGTENLSASSRASVINAAPESMLRTMSHVEVTSLALEEMGRDRMGARSTSDNDLARRAMRRGDLEEEEQLNLALRISEALAEAGETPSGKRHKSDQKHGLERDDTGLDVGATPSFFDIMDEFPAPTTGL
jgi:hypothetical protein